jgi:signal peptidase II
MARGLRAPLAIAATVVLIDQLTKEWALDALGDGSVVDVIGSLRFNLAFNEGMAFSQGKGWGPVIGIVALGVVVALLISVGRSASRWYPLAVGLIVGGALGNLTDRLFRDRGWLRGRVVDFIDVQWWPIFNVADIGVTVGGALLLLTGLVTADPTPETLPKGRAVGVGEDAGSGGREILPGTPDDVPLGEDVGSAGPVGLPEGKDPGGA